MNVKNCEKIEKSQVVLTVEVTAEEFDKAINKAYLKQRSKIRVPGFRPGKASRKMIEKMYGVEVFYEDAVNDAISEAYPAAIEAQDLRVVGYPSVELEDKVTVDGFTFKATVPVYPEVTLGQYKGLTAEKAEVVVSDEDVEAEIENLVKRETHLESVERAAENGDTAVIDFEGFLEGKPFDGGKGTNHNLVLGSGSFVPGFEEQVVGMKAGEEKDIDITFPEKYAAELAGKAVVFHVKVNEVKCSNVPTVDDEFAKDVSEFETLDELKADLRKNLTKKKEDEAQRAFEDSLMEQVADNITAEVPDALIEQQQQAMSTI